MARGDGSGGEWEGSGALGERDTVSPRSKTGIGLESDGPEFESHLRHFLLCDLGVPALLL